MVWPAVAAAVSIGSQLYSASKSRDGAQNAEDAARRNARFVREETEETLRRQRISDEMERGQGVATVAAAGLRGTGSTGDYLTFLQEEREKANVWTMRAGQLRASAIRRGGQAVASGLRSDSALYTLGAVSTAVKAFDRGFGGPKSPQGSSGSSLGYQGDVTGYEQNRGAV